MGERNLCCENNEISLYFARMSDKKLVFDMSREDPEIFNSMFYGECEPETWEEFLKNENEFYCGKKSRNNYLLIEYDSEIVGTVSYSYNQAKIENMELDIWLRSTKYTGKGLGTKTLLLLTDYLNCEYSIETFIIRPGKENARAICCYKKSGFEILDNFDSGNYYDDADEQEWGEGDYGVNGTFNMVKRYL